MNKLKIKIKKQIILYMINNFSSPIKRIDEYLNEHIEEIIEELDIQIDADDVIYEIGDIHNINTKKFIELALEEIQARGFKSRILIKYSPPFYFIQLSDYGKIVNSDLRKKLELKLSLFNTIPNKGYKYQQFCNILLNDFGFISIHSKYSDDGGIDIFTKYDISIKNKIFNYFGLLNEIYLLVQVKCHNDKIGTPIVKKLIQDSQYIKINENDKLFIGNIPTILVMFSNSGFNNEAVRFSDKNRVHLVSTEELIDFLCTVENVESLNCIKYVDKINSNIRKRQVRI